jgi:DNA-binding CsgD family transcriptional regulator
MELLGRETELASVGNAIERASSGEPRALGLFGEAGIGKSALLGAVRERAEAAGMLVLEGRAAEHERSVPFGLVVDALDDHVATLHPRRVEAVGPDLAAVLPAAAAARAEPQATPAAGPAERFRYHRAVRALLELLARERPVALLLDDLHWADDASVELVLHLLRRPPRAPHLLAFALRPQDPAARLLDAARAAPAWDHVVPRPLAADAARALLAGLPESLRERIVGEAGGNPLFLEELRRVAHDGDGALPQTLMAAVGLEIAALPPASRALIEGAAVAGDPFDPELAAVAAGIGFADAVVPIDRLVTADLVRSTGDGRALAFRHPLVRRAVYDAAPPAWRIAAHERVAAVLAARGAGPSVLADHVERYARQGDDDAVELLAAAAAAAADTAPAACARLYRSALRLLPDGDVERRARLLGPMALAEGASGRLEQARDTLDEVLGLLGPDQLRLRIRLVDAAAGIESMIGQVAEMRRRLMRELEGVPPEEAAELELALAHSEYYMVDFDAMSDWAGRAAAHARADQASIRACADALRGVSAILGGDPRAGNALLDSALGQLAAIDDAALAGRIEDPFLIGAGAVLAMRTGDALVPLSRGLEIARSTRQDSMIPMLASVRSMAFHDQLRLDEALRDAETATEAARLIALDGQVHRVVMMLALIHWLRGERSEAIRDARECVETAQRVEPSAATATSLCNVAAIWVDEDPERCIREMVAAGGPMLERIDQSWATWLLGVLVRGALALGRLDDAERWAERIERRARQSGTLAALTRAASARAGVLLARGDAARAAERASAAADAADRGGARLDGVQARLIAGRAQAAAGDRDAAIASFQRVAADASSGGAGLFVEEAGRELRRLGSRLGAGARRAAASASASAAELTEREREIADLVAEGRSNKQVAAAIFLSEKTIEHHLSRIYAKLGVRSRVELARLVRAQDG